MRLLLETGGFHALATWKRSDDWSPWREAARRASLLLSRAGQTGFTAWGGLDQVFHEAFSASLSMGPEYLCQADFVLCLVRLFNCVNKPRKGGPHPLILEQAPHGGLFERKALKSSTGIFVYRSAIPLQSVYRDKGTLVHTKTQHSQFSQKEWKHTMSL